MLAARPPLRVAVLLAAVVLALALSACGGGEGSSPTATVAASPSSGSPAPVSPAPGASSTGDPDGAATLVRQFPDPSGPLNMQVAGVADWDGAQVRHVTYRSDGATVTATISLPDGDGPFPAVLYAPGVTCRREMFSADVAALQREGFAALVIDPPDGRDPFVQPITADPEVAAAAHVRYVTDLRRGLDVLRSLPEVDPDRIGYVGYSWGAFVGGYLAGLGEPVRAWVLTYAGADWVGADPTTADGFTADPAIAVGAAAPSAYLFIAGVDDFLFSRQSVTRYSSAATGNRRLVWLAGGHGDYWAAPDGAAVVDHRAWLQRRL
jgi:dienelactone hydrolase